MPKTTMATIESASRGAVHQRCSMRPTATGMRAPASAHTTIQQSTKGMPAIFGSTRLANGIATVSAPMGIGEHEAQPEAPEETLAAWRRLGGRVG